MLIAVGPPRRVGLCECVNYGLASRHVVDNIVHGKLEMFRTRLAGVVGGSLTSKFVRIDIRTGNSRSTWARSLIGELLLNGRFCCVQSFDQVAMKLSVVQSAQPLMNLSSVAACFWAID